MPDCERCSEPIKEDATECPHCGNNPASKMKKGILGVTGTGLFLGMFFPPIALLAVLGVVGAIGYWRQNPRPHTHDV